MASYQLIFPEYLDGYEHETESKGYLVDVKVVIGDATLELAVYDPVRLAQEVGDEVRSAGYFAVARLLVVPKVTREEVSKAVQEMSTTGFQELA
jgi:hypothetical protein